MRRLQQNMPEYKTPIRVQRDPTKAFGQKLGKYKLPFQKDEPIQQKEFSISQQGKLPMKITSQAKLKKDIQKPVYKRENSSWIQKRSSVGNENDESSQHVNEKEFVEIDNISQVKELSNKKKEETTENQSLNQLPIQVNLVSHAVKQEEKPKDVQTNKKQMTELLQQLEKRKRFYSSHSNYSEDQNIMADHSVQVRQTQELPKQITIPRLPVIGQRQYRSRKKAHSLQKDQNQLWSAISSQLQRTRNHSQMRKEKRKISMSRVKLQKLSSSEQDNECEAIGNKLKKKRQVQQLSQLQENSSKDDIYASLQPIREEKIENANEVKPNKQKRKTFLEQIKGAIELQQKKTQKKQFSLQQYLESYQKIRQVNPFFRKLNQFGGCVMLSIGKLKILEPGSVLFTQGEPVTHISIIVLGKVILTQTYNPIKRYALTGQSLGEEALFDESKPYSVRLSNTSSPVFYKLQARAYNRVCLLRIKLGKYYKVSQELNAIGEKLLFNLIDNLFRINYIKKQATLHQQVRNRLQTETLLKAKRKPSHFFFH